MDISLELNSLNCQLINHSNAQILGFCIDPNCKESNKFICPECIFDVHSQHKLIKIKELSNLIQIKYRDYKDSLENEKKLIEEYKNNELKQREKIEQLQKDIFKEIEKKINLFLEDLKNKYNELNNIDAKNFVNLKEYEDFFIGNAAPILKPDLSKLSAICFNIYKENENDKHVKEKNVKDETPNPSNDKLGKPPLPKEEKSLKKKNFLFNNFNKEFDKFINEQKSSTIKFIKEDFLIIPVNFFSNQQRFEWCKSTYSGYDFFYELNKNNTKGTKIKSNGTMTVLRAKEKLEDNLKYKIKFKVGLKKGGDFDLGIGTEKCGDSCWLRTRESICVSNIGIMHLDINMDNSKRLKDNDIVDLEINTQENKKSFKAYINDELVCFLDFNLEDVYIMAAIRNNSNFIEVLNYEISTL